MDDRNKDNRWVYVQDMNGEPLMPTKRCGRIRHLLKEGKAVPVRNEPFTVRLTYEAHGEPEGVWLGIDPGRQNIGIGASAEGGRCVLLAEIETGNRSIKKRMDERRTYRHARRHHARLRKQRKALRDGSGIKKGKDDLIRNKKPCRSRDISYPGMEGSVTCKAIRGAEAQFCNRKRAEGWLPPSGTQLVQMHIMAVEKAMAILPIRHVVLERNMFDFQKMEKQDIRAWEYQKGTLYGYKSYKEYIDAVQEGRCLLCGNEGIDHYHHIVPRSRNGSNTPANIAGLCIACHDAVHKDSRMQEELLARKEGLAKRYGVSLLNSVMPRLIDEMSALCTEKGIAFSMTDGYVTHATRERLGLPKRHSVDGYAISLAGREDAISTEDMELPKEAYRLRRFKKRSRVNIYKLGSRKYLLDGKVIAVNRHKATGQTEDSLEEYMDSYAEAHSKDECQAHLRSLRVDRARRTYYANQKDRSILYAGDTVLYQKKNKTDGKVKRLVFAAEPIKLAQGIAKGKGVVKSMKYCRRLEGGCMPFIVMETI